MDAKEEDSWGSVGWNGLIELVVWDSIAPVLDIFVFFHCRSSRGGQDSDSEQDDIKIRMEFV